MEKLKSRFKGDDVHYFKFHEDLNVCVQIHITFKQSIKKANKLISNRFSVRMNRELLSSPHAITVLRGVGP